MSADRPIAGAAPGSRVSAAGEATLSSALGGEGFARHEPVFVDGVAIGITLRPADGDGLARTLAALTELGLSALVRGGGTQLVLGNPPTSADVLLSTEHLSGVDEFDPLDGVVHAGAGTTIARLAAEVRKEGWELPLESIRAGGTLGGALSVAAAGPRRLGLGRPRDCVLGLSVSLASGERTSCGGRVVKNVTGYDLGKLYTGSLGGLAVIESAWLRLRPLSVARAARCLLSKGGPPDARGFALALDASRRTTARTVAWVSPELASRHDLAPGGGTWVLLAEYTGDEASVEHDVAWLEEKAAGASLSVVATDEMAVDRLALAQASGRVRARLAALPTRLEATCEPLIAAGLALVIHPGTGFVYAIAGSGEAPISSGKRHADAGAADPETARALAAVEASVARGGADLRLEELPRYAKEGRDVFGAPGERLPLLRAIKEQFDPTGTLNPGRSQGRI